MGLWCWPTRSWGPRMGLLRGGTLEWEGLFWGGPDPPHPRGPTSLKQCLYGMHPPSFLTHLACDAARRGPLPSPFPLGDAAMSGASIRGLIQALPQFREVLGRLSVHIWVRGVGGGWGGVGWGGVGWQARRIGDGGTD